MDREDVINLMASVGRRVKKRTKDTVRDILRLAETYRYLGGKFSFSTDADLEKEAKRLLVLLSDMLLDDAASWASKTVEEDDNGIAIAWGLRDRGGKSELDRIDEHNSYLYDCIQCWIAIGFAAELSQTSILANILAYPDPSLSPLSKEVIVDLSWLTGWGRGFAKDTVKANTVIAQDIINSTYQKGIIEKYSKNPKIVGYRVHRGSTYDCPLCDELCIGIHPLYEMVLPAHPHCVCFTTPVYASEI